MKPYLSAVTSHYFLNLLVGVCLAGAGFKELSETQEIELVDGSHGVILFGLIYIFKALVALVEGSHQLFIGLKKKDKLFLTLRALSESFVFHFVTAVLLILVGAGEIIEELTDNNSGMSGVWQWGIIGAGLMHLSTASLNITEALSFSKLNIDDGYSKWLLRLFTYLHFPKVELLLGMLIVFISIWEELINDSMPYDVGAHHGLAFFALTRIIIVLSFSSTSESLNTIDRDNDIR